MKKLFFAAAMAWLLMLNTTIAQTTLTKDERMQWWREARFGMFIHWGVYAQLASAYDGKVMQHPGAEWIMNFMKIPVANYQAVAKQFNPIKFDADEWVRMAKNAGMKYIIITAKHHDGFAMFKTSASKWNIVDATPYGKDVLKQLAAACKRQGMKLGFYYSEAQDWNNPGGAATLKKANTGGPNPDSAKIDAYTKEHSGHWDPAQTTSTFAEYIDRVSVPQVRELLTNYGDVAVLWWDTPTDMTDDAALKLQALLKLQPKIITNNRLKKNFPGDTKTPEQSIPNASELAGVDWETCMTMNGTWGYSAYDHDFKSAETLIHNLCDIASKGGNYLLNIGPKGDGTFPEESIDRLREIGKWMKVNSEAIYATKASPLPDLSWGRCTKKEDGNTTILYLMVFNWPKDGKLIVPGVANKIISAKLFGSGEKCTAVNKDNTIELNLSQNAPNAYASVVKVVVEGKVGILM
jgi:alpha-L-fucosidase